jgi:hypothetical protein
VRTGWNWATGVRGSCDDRASSEDRAPAGAHDGPAFQETHAGAGTPSQHSTYRDTATMGVVLGAAGLASAAFGTVLLYLDRNPPVMPVATVADHHVLFSLNGAF